MKKQTPEDEIVDIDINVMGSMKACCDSVRRATYDYLRKKFRAEALAEVEELLDKWFDNLDSFNELREKVKKLKEKK